MSSANRWHQLWPSASSSSLFPSFNLSLSPLPIETVWSSNASLAFSFNALSSNPTFVMVPFGPLIGSSSLINPESKIIVKKDEKDEKEKTLSDTKLSSKSKSNQNLLSNSSTSTPSSSTTQVSQIENGDIVFSSYTSPVVGFATSSISPIIAFIRDNTYIEILAKQPSTNQWYSLASFRIISRSVKISKSSLFFTKESLFVAFSETYINSQSSKVCDVYISEINFREKERANPPEPEALLRGVPDMNVTSFKDGFAFVPRYTSNADLSELNEANIIYFWSIANKNLISLIWGKQEGTDNFEIETTEDKNSIYQTPWMTCKSIWPKNQDPSLYHVVSHSTHPITKELMFLEKSGRIVGCFLDSVGSPQLKVLTSLKLDTYEKIIGFVYHYTNFIVFDHSFCKVYSSRNGSFVEKIQYPTNSNETPNLWIGTGVAYKLGIHFNTNIWEYRSRKAFDSFQTEIDQSQEKILDAALYSKQWSMGRQHSKYILDLSLEHLVESDETENVLDKINYQYEKQKEKQKEKHESSICTVAALYLLQSQSLESPTLPIAILDTAGSHRANIVNAIVLFLEKYNGKDGEDASLLDSFYARTPLNAKLKPLLESYLKLQNSKWKDLMSDDLQILLKIKEKATEIFSILERAKTMAIQGKTKSDLSDRAKLESLSYSHPTLVLDSFYKFFEFPRFDNLEENEIENTVSEGDCLLLDYLFQEETIDDMYFENGSYSRSSRPYFLELLLWLIGTERVDHLHKFVLYAHYCHIKANEVQHIKYQKQRLTRREKQIHLDNLKRKAISVVIPMKNIEKYKQSGASSTTSISHLYISIGEKVNALKFMLALSQWEQAIELVNSVMDKDVVEHFELFHILIINFFHHMKSSEVESKIQVDVIERIWEVMPRNYNVYDLLSILKQLDTDSSESEIVSPDGNSLTLGLIRNQIIKMFTRESSWIKPRKSFSSVYS